MLHLTWRTRIIFLLALSLSAALGNASSFHINQVNESAASKSASSSFPDISDVGRPALRVFTETDGLPQMSVTAITIDAKNYLWAGTQDGIAYYNGRIWTAVPMPNRTDSRTIRSVLATSDGAVWIGTDGAGLFRLKGGEWTVFDRSAGLPSNRIMAILESKESAEGQSLWIGTDNGVACLRNDEWKLFDTSSGLPAGNVMALLEITSAEGSRSLLVGTYSGGVGRYANGEWSVINGDSGLPSNTVQSLLQDRSGAIWIGTNRGVARLEDGVTTVFDTDSGLPGNDVFTLAETVSPDGTNAIWVGTNGGGLTRFQHGRWITFDAKRGMPAVIMSLMVSDSPEGASVLWVGTNGGGLIRFQPKSWASFTADTGLASPAVTSLLETSAADGSRVFWFGTYSGGVARWERGKWTVFNATSGLPDNGVWILRETVSAGGARAVWVGTDRGAARYERGRWRSFNRDLKALDYAVNAIIETIEPDGERGVCVGTDGGLACYRNDRWVSFEKSSGFPQSRVMSLLETRTADGVRTLWAGTRGSGLARLHGDRWEVFSTRTGFPHDSVSRMIETLSPDARLSLWAGTDGGGLARLRDDRWTVLNIESGMPSNLITNLFKNDLPDGRQELWIGTMGGVARLDPDAENPSLIVISDTTMPALPNNTIYEIRSDWRDRIYLFTNRGVARLTPLTPFPEKASDYELYTFTTEDGLPNRECVQGASMVDTLGRIWAGTIEGAAVFDPAREIEDRSPKPLYIERTLAGDSPISLAQNESLAYDENHLSFEFAMLSYFHESATRFRTQMVGLEGEPSQWSADYKRDFGYLPDGDFVLRVWGRDYAGNVSGPVELAFEVRPAPWRTWWAYALYALGAGLISSSVAYSIYRYRVARLIEIERVRTRIATDLHDDIGSSLSQIAILSEVVMQNTQKEDPETSEPLTKIAVTSREMVDSMSDIVWAINPNRDTLRDLVHRMRRFASDIFGARNIDFRFIAPPMEENIKLGADMRRQIFLIFKESVNNCAKHSECEEAEIKFAVEGNWLVLEVRDNGRGFEAESDSDGHGLMSMKERAESLGGQFEIRSARGKGTTVSLKMPVERGRKWRLRKSPPE